MFVFYDPSPARVIQSKTVKMGERLCATGDTRKHRERGKKERKDRGGNKYYPIDFVKVACMLAIELLVTVGAFVNGLY